METNDKGLRLETDTGASQATRRFGSFEKGADPLAIPLLLGLGLFLAWSLCLPWVYGHMGAGPRPASNAGAAVHGMALICLAFACNRRRVALFRKSTVVCSAALATLAPVLTFAAAFAGTASAQLLAGIASLCEGLALAFIYLLWSEQYVKYPPIILWPAYAASFAMAPAMFFVLTAVSLPIAVATVLALPLLSCWMLLRCDERTSKTETCGERVLKSWRFPWRPALLMAAFSFVHYMLMHLYGGTASTGQLGALACSSMLFAACTVFFERFDPRLLYKLCPPLMVCALLAFPLGNQVLAEVGGALGYAGFTGFSLFMAFILSSICFRYGIHAAWLFGIIEGCSVLSHAAGSAVGMGLLMWVENAQGNLALPLDVAVVALVLLSMLLLSERDFVTTWGIRPADSGFAPIDSARADLSTAESGRTGTEEQSDMGAVPATIHAADPQTDDGSFDDLDARCARIARLYGLTHREQDVLVLLSQGHSARGIEETLFISHNTAKGHIRHVYAKLGVHSREEAVAIVREMK